MSLLGTEVWRFSRDIVTKEQNSSTANRAKGLHPLEWYIQIKPTDMRSTANSSLNVVRKREDIQLHTRFVIAHWPFWEKYWGAMNWFRMAAVAT